jgi:hypothetical protein
MKRINSLDEIDEPCTRKLIAHYRSLDPSYGSQAHQLLFCERMAEAQRRAPCPGGKVTCGDGWHTTGAKFVDIGQGGKRRTVSCYDADLIKQIATEQERRDR